MKPSNHLSAPLAEAICFSKLCCALFGLLVFAAAAEGGALWLAGYRYVSRSSLHETCISTLSVSSDGNSAVSRVGFRQSHASHPVEHDVVWHDLAQARATRLHLGHLSPEVVAVSPFSKTLAFGCMDGAVYLCRPQTREDDVAGSAASAFLLSSPRHGPILQLQFSPDNRFLVAADRRHVYVWRAATWELLHRRAHGADWNAILTFPYDGRTVLTSGKNAARLTQWDVETGKQLKRFAFKTSIVAAALSPTNRQIAVVNTESTITLYDLNSGKEQWRRTRKGSEGCHVAFTSKGGEVSVGGAPGEICLYDARNGQRCGPLTQSAMIKGFTIAANGLLYSWDRCGDIRVWNIEHRQPVSGFSLLTWGRGESQVSAAGPVYDRGILATVASRKRS